MQSENGLHWKINFHSNDKTKNQWRIFAEFDISFFLNLITYSINKFSYSFNISKKIQQYSYVSAHGRFPPPPPLPSIYVYAPATFSPLWCQKWLKSIEQKLIFINVIYVALKLLRMPFSLILSNKYNNLVLRIQKCACVRVDAWRCI